MILYIQILALLIFAASGDEFQMSNGLNLNLYLKTGQTGSPVQVTAVPRRQTALSTQHALGL